MNSGLVDEGINLFEKKEYEKARKFFLRKSDDIIAQYYLGAIYRMGLGVTNDQKEAFSWFLKAAKQGHKESQFLVGCSYIDVLGFKTRETDLVKVDFDRFEQKAKNDVSTWQVDIAYYELNGIGVKPCDKEGFKWIEDSARQGYVKAQVALAELYDYGIGIKEDKEKMVEWYKKAASNGNANAYRRLSYYSLDYEKDFPKTIDLLLKAYYLGDCRAAYTIGKRYEYEGEKYRNLQEAYKWYKVAAEECNHKDALIKLGDFYKEGIVVDRSLEHSCKYYKEARELFEISYDADCSYVYDKLFEIYNLGYKEAIPNHELIKYLVCLADHNQEARLKLRELYEAGCDIGEKYTTFFNLLDKAVKSDKEAQIKIGYNYLFDYSMDDTVKNYAFKWYMEDAVNDKPDAQYLISRIHFGRNNHVDYPYWLKKAADNGHTRALFELALYYDYKRLPEALEYMKKSSHSSVAAQILLGYKYAHGEQVVIDYEEAYNLYQLAAKNMLEITEISELKHLNRMKMQYNAANDDAELLAQQGDVSAQLYMGCLYQYGFEVKRNLEKAIYWYKMAKENGSLEAGKQVELIQKELSDKGDIRE